jgi:hypothetical protein
MHTSRILALTAALSIGIAAAACYTPAPAYASGQVTVDVGIAPDCPYGYYDVPPYDCAPYGYYGPEWFTGGVFIGAGPWFHGPSGFHGHVNNHFDAQHGYTGPRPNKGDKAEQGKDINHMEHFKGNEVRDGRGHTGKK